MKKQSLFSAGICILIVLVFFLGFFVGRNTAHQGTALAALSVSLIPEKSSTDVNSLFPAPAEKININTADKDELAGLPGIGETLAQEIINYRQTHGPFTSVDQLKEVNGIGEKRLEDIRSLVTTGE